MSEGKYPVEWRGKAYAMSDLTVGVKKAFCHWLKLKLTAEGIEMLGTRPDLLSGYLADLPALIWWGDAACSPTVGKALTAADGGRHLNRLLFGDSVKGMSDAYLDALVSEKEAEQDRASKTMAETGFVATPDNPYPPANDYMRAIYLIRDASGPK